jgi:hypothetical protein
MRYTCAIAGAMLALGILASPAMAEPPFEPNDTTLEAAGPLAANQTYTAALETGNDQDYYYFYVTGPTQAQVTFTLTDLGGSSGFAEIRGSLDESHGDSIDTFGGLTKTGAYGTQSISLQPGKYYLHVSPEEGYGESYEFTGSGTTGAFGPYSTIQAQCAAAQGPVNQYEAQVATAEVNLKKAEAKLKKYGESRKPKVRKKVHAKVAHVKSVVAAEKESLKGAEKAESPWCFIPQ